ncbi:methyltransferase domain-containing protein [Actinoplanes sp. NPDC051861]|uniref:class I SAM-dependent methyltransferase n=1 Tax=Actinoplanes sp. NPDC051861 TaxID=3155170 RepID=UPI00343E1DF7
MAAEYDNVGVDFVGPMGVALASAAGIRAGDRVLDVGCGRGAVLFPAAEAVGPTGHVTGIDLAPAMIELTRKDVAHLPQVRVAVGDAQTPDFPAESFDVVTAGLLLFFLPDPAGALSAYRKLLRPGGTLALSSFAQIDPSYRAAMQAVARHAIDPPPAPVLAGMFDDADRLREAVERAGFNGTKIERLTVKSQFRDLDHFITWVGSHAGRGVLNRVPGERLPGLKDELATILPEPPEISTTIFVTVAHRIRNAF